MNFSILQKVYYAARIYSVQYCIILIFLKKKLFKKNMRTVFHLWFTAMPPFSFALIRHGSNASIAMYNQHRYTSAQITAL